MSTAVVSHGWNLHRTFQAVSYALVATAFAPTALSGEVGLAAPLAFTGAALASLLRDPRSSVPRPQTARVWTAVVLLSFAGLLVWSVRDGNWLLHALQFALLLTVSRFFQRRFAKDHLQLFALSFILLLVAAIVQPGPLFAVCFLAYAVLTMWGLTLLHLVWQIEVQTGTGPEHLLPPAAPKRRWLGLLPAKTVPPAPVWPNLPLAASTVEWRSRRLLGLRYFAATSVLSLLVLGGSAVFFFLFPRLGMGFFFTQTRGASSVIGFSTDAELGQFGALKSNAEVVMRLTFPDDPLRLQQSVRLRGVSFDTFVGHGWSRAKEDPWPLRGNAGVMRVPRVEPPDPAKDVSWRAEIYLEPMGRDQHVLFAPPKTFAVELLDTRFDYLRGRRKSVQRTNSGDLSYVAPADTALHYAVQVSEPISAVQEAARLRQAKTQMPSDWLARYTQLPADLDPRVTQLAQQLAGQQTTWYDKALAVESALRSGWDYSLAGDQDADKPLEDFLFGKKSGHCEYFATSMALLLRSQGVPARTVHGFAGGAYNPIGNYRMIRQADAHAWVEVLFPQIGWRTFDPTPASGQSAPADDGVVQRMRQLLDGASLVWYQWVVEYDLERQVEVLRSLGGILKDLRGDGAMAKLMGKSSRTEEVTDPDKPGTQTTIPAWLWIVVGLAGLGAVIRVVLLVVRGRQLEPFDRAVARASDRLQRALARRGWDRQPHETWHSVARRLDDQAPEAGSALRAFAQTYDDARYSAQGVEPYRTHLLELGRAAVRQVRLAQRRTLDRKEASADAQSPLAGPGLPRSPKM